MFSNVAAALVLSLLASGPSALAAVTINGPSSSQYWVQNASNVISWSGYSQSDQNPVTITVTNSNNASLNGAFSIAENVHLEKGSFTVTNVTLKPSAGYIVNFVDPKNLSHSVAQSAPFEVKPPGTQVAAGATPTGSSPAATATAPANQTASGASAHPTSSASSAGGGVRDSFTAIIPMLGASVAFAMLGAITTF